MLNSDKHGHFGSIYEYQCFHDDHDDVMQRKGFPHLLPFGKPSGYKGPVTWSSSVLFDVSLNTGWTNSRFAGDLKGRGTHVTSHQHRFLFRLSDGVTEMPDEISRNLTRYFTCQCGTEGTHMQGFILHMTDMWRWNLSAIMAPSFLGGTVGTGGFYNDNIVPPGTSKRPTDSIAHISNHNETGLFKNSQFLYTIVSKNINTLLIYDYSDITWASRSIKLLSTRRRWMVEHRWSIAWVTNGDRRIPLTKGEAESVSMSWRQHCCW